MCEERYLPHDFQVKERGKRGMTSKELDLVVTCRINNCFLDICSGILDFQHFLGTVSMALALELISNRQYNFLCDSAIAVANDRLCWDGQVFAP